MLAQPSARQCPLRAEGALITLRDVSVLYMLRLHQGLVGHKGCRE